MKVKNVNLEYYVFYFDNGTFKRHNVLYGIAEEVAKRVRSKKAYLKIYDRETLTNWLIVYFTGKYWARAEWECLVTPLFAKENSYQIKLDVWEQIKPNIRIITDHIIKEMKLDYE